MMLIKAECLARKDPSALKLNELQNVMLKINMQIFPEVSGDKLLEVVLEERQRRDIMGYDF